MFKICFNIFHKALGFPLRKPLYSVQRVHILRSHSLVLTESFGGNSSVPIAQCKHWDLGTYSVRSQVCLGAWELDWKKPGRGGMASNGRG